MLSVKELVESRDKTPPELPSFGTKDFAPVGSAEEHCEIKNSILQIQQLVSYQTVKTIGSLSQAIWQPELGLAKVVHQTGSQWAVVGHTINQELYIYPEEALYMLETGTLEIRFNEVPLSIQRAYSVLLQPCSDVSIEKYRVYSNLNANGFKVLRHSPKNTVTKYEKQLDVHKLHLKLKHFDNNSSGLKRPQETCNKNLDPNKKLKVEEQNFPIDYKNENAEEIFKAIQIFRPSDDCNVETSLNFDYDIYTESNSKHSFKKSCLQLPNFRVVIHRSEDSMPSLSEICSLSKKLKDEVPVIHAIVFPDYIAFHEMNSVIIPNAYE